MSENLSGSRTHLRGFASMTPERRREVARSGGRAVPAEKRSFSMDNALARAAGHKGGSNVDPAKRSFSLDHELASRAGRNGGLSKNRALPADQGE